MKTLPSHATAAFLARLDDLVSCGNGWAEFADGSKIASLAGVLWGENRLEGPAGGNLRGPWLRRTTNMVVAAVADRPESLWFHVATFLEGRGLVGSRPLSPLDVAMVGPPVIQRSAFGHSVVAVHADNVISTVAEAERVGTRPVVFAATVRAFGDIPIKAADLDRLLAPVTGADTVLIADETLSGVYRFGPGLASDEWSHRPDLIFVGPGIVNGHWKCFCALAAPSLGMPIMPIDQSVRDRIDQSLGFVRDPAVADSLGANGRLLGRGLSILSSQHRLYDLVGAGFTYTVRPRWARSGTDATADPYGLLKLLAENGLWVPALADGRLLLAPPVTDDAARLAFILEVLDATL